MNLIAIRTMKRQDGIFSDWTDEAGAHLFFSVTHAYPDSIGGWEPKIPPGTYRCVRGHHTIGHGVHAHLIETFEITGVAGHTGLLVHPGNWQSASEGCECTGRAFAESAQGEMVTHSEETFEAFMAMQEGLDEFTLTVRDN